MNKFEKAITYASPDKIKEIIEDTSKAFPMYSSDEIKDFVRDRLGAECWVNDKYQVEITKINNQMVWLSIKRLDKNPIHDWRDLQEIKNQLVGPECEGIELYPAESRVVDTANQYHLWVMTDPKFRYPFGFQDRFVTGDSGRHSKQRPF